MLWLPCIRNSMTLFTRLLVHLCSNASIFSTLLLFKSTYTNSLRVLPCQCYTLEAQHIPSLFGTRQRACEELRRLQSQCADHMAPCWWLRLDPVLHNTSQVQSSRDQLVAKPSTKEIVGTRTPPLAQQRRRLTPEQSKTFMIGDSRVLAR